MSFSLQEGRLLDPYRIQGFLRDPSSLKSIELRLEAPQLQVAGPAVDDGPSTVIHVWLRFNKLPVAEKEKWTVGKIRCLRQSP